MKIDAIAMTFLVAATALYGAPAVYKAMREGDPIGLVIVAFLAVMAWLTWELWKT